MDATTRWETEALRAGQPSRATPPRPSSKRRQRTALDGTSWVTLREAEEATGIPVNTLRKWVRKSGLASYLESDGETPVRMVDLDAVRARASELGREIAPAPTPDLPTTAPPKDHPMEPPAAVAHDAGPIDELRSIEPGDSTASEASEVPEQAAMDTMIVPIDAWNKMLNQLGNLHEAGQQLAAAAERAAKAETEAAFLRERLAELRADDASAGTAPPDSAPTPEPDTSDTWNPPPEDPNVVSPSAPTTTYWRYVTTGWRRRRRASRD